MSWEYRCSKCGSMLNPGNMVTLVAINGGAQMLVGFHPDPGNYDLYKPPEAEFEQGDAWDFFCPVCHTNLKSDTHENLCELIQIEEGVHKRLFFSRIAGERATYVVRDEIGIEKHGDHADRYDDTIQWDEP